MSTVIRVKEEVTKTRVRWAREHCPVVKTTIPVFYYLPPRRRCRRRRHGMSRRRITARGDSEEAEHPEPRGAAS